MAARHVGHAGGPHVKTKGHACGPGQCMCFPVLATTNHVAEISRANIGSCRWTLVLLAQQDNLGGIFMKN